MLRCALVVTMCSSLHTLHTRTDYFVDAVFQRATDRLFLIAGTHDGNMDILHVNLDSIERAASLYGGHSATVRAVYWDCDGAWSFLLSLRRALFMPLGAATVALSQIWWSAAASLSLRLRCGVVGLNFCGRLSRYNLLECMQWPVFLCTCCTLA